MNSKNVIRLIVLAGLLAWPGVETYRLWIAKQQLGESARNERVASERLAYLENLQVPSSQEPAAVAVPVSNAAQP